MSLSGGECHDVSGGCKLFESMGKSKIEFPMLMDKAYEGDATRALAENMDYLPIAPPKANRKNPWEYSKDLYKQRNIVERRSVFFIFYESCPQLLFLFFCPFLFLFLQSHIAGGQ